MLVCLADEVLPENREGVDLYVSSVWGHVAVFVQSIAREVEQRTSSPSFNPTLMLRKRDSRRTSSVSIMTSTVMIRFSLSLEGAELKR